ncbi:cobalamin B12-binding domain-containing protein [Methylobacterium sp. Leaf89]|uniref:cobalamin B12-binding domain-containing protein n=1 Tax=Methylobacterium sp. Leaf89 TaxID=1736245 RepID=UPI000AB3B895|nr:cobalamin B12-binding domain-containing protein [Methylobacterium sp. Leaf89]
MSNLASSTAAWTDPSVRQAGWISEARLAYARKRTAEESRQRALALSCIVETDIIPRLKLLHPQLAPAASTPLAKPDAQQIEAFTQLLLCSDLSAASDAVRDHLAKGYSAESMFLELLVPAASLLGRLWDDDLCDFIEVTVGVARLQLLLSQYRSEPKVSSHDENRAALLMGAPGELHTFGVAVVEQFLQVAGWQVSCGLASSPGQISRLVGSTWFDVVGLTLSCETRIDGLAASIQSIRHVSRNRSVGIMVGGPVFLDKPELVERVGADASAVDAPTAVLLAQRLLDISLEERPRPDHKAPSCV